MGVDALGEACLVYELLAGGAGGASIWLEERKAWMRMCTTWWMHFWHSTMRADHHAERLIREAGLGRWQSDAVGDHLRVGGRQALG